MASGSFKGMPNVIVECDSGMKQLKVLGDAEDAEEEAQLQKWR